MMFYRREKKINEELWEIAKSNHQKKKKKLVRQ